MRHLFGICIVGWMGCSDPDHTGSQTLTPTATDSGSRSTLTPPDTDGIPLIDPTAWRRAEMVLDPIPSHQPKHIVCDPLGTHEADGAFEVDTSHCNYALLHQPLNTHLPAGAELEILLSHGALVWTEPALGHVALALDGDVIWERTVPIPSDAWVYQDVITLEHPVSEGSQWTLHCHNHGTNSWRLYGATWRNKKAPSL